MNLFKNKVAIVSLGLVALMVFFVGSVALSMNVDYLRTHPTKFRFWHYPLMDQVREVMIDLLPVGTPKAYVDQVLVEGGGARVREKETLPNVFIYKEPWLPWYYKKPPGHVVIFDKNLRLLNFHPRGGGPAYQDQVTHRDLVNEWTIRERQKHIMERANDGQP